VLFQSRPNQPLATSAPKDDDAVEVNRELTCSECACSAAGEVRGWQAHLVDLNDDGEDEVALFCPSCAAREFDGYRRGTND
jgi:hypothetical protein